MGATRSRWSSAGAPQRRSHPLIWVRGTGDPDRASDVAYERVLIKEFRHEGAPTHAEILDQGEAGSSTRPAATRSGR